jgi:hypothetical protein
MSISNVGEFHPLKRNQNRKITKSWNFHLLKGNIIGKLRKVGNFHLLNGEYIMKTSKRSKIYIGNVGKNRICPSQKSKLFPITLIVWSAPPDVADAIFNQFL